MLLLRRVAEDATPGLGWELIVVVVTPRGLVDAALAAANAAISLFVCWCFGGVRASEEFARAFAHKRPTTYVSLYALLAAARTHTNEGTPLRRRPPNIFVIFQNGLRQTPEKSTPEKGSGGFQI